ncbi:glycosyltransferase family 2 protein [Candidatus Saccharibacteria bacterium]|nr:glycosyltransferase family 2 protein [Candidatus Saccharibacteria bacterium]
MKHCDIIIPIYNAYDCLKECIDSVLKNTNFKLAHIICIDDLSPDKRVVPLLEKYKKKNPDKITILRNTKNLGFVKTVNKGMRYSKNDILLLNSDTIATKSWLTKIQNCAYLSKTIATATPFSNNRTPMTPLPEDFRKQGFPNGWTLEKMAKIIEDCSLHLYPELPSSHGFCMYIKRAAINKVGFFDEDNFGKGYGEENDFCFRCFKHNYKHILCDDTYIFHKGAQSFLDTGKMHDDTLIKKYQGIMAKTGQWYSEQNLKKITDNIILAVGTKEERTNILAINNKHTQEEVESIIDTLVNEYNIHVLQPRKKCFMLSSYFSEGKLDTAVYERPTTVGVEEIQSLGYQIMIDEIKRIFGITVMVEVEELINGKLPNIIRRSDKSKKINFNDAQQKMLECDKFKNIITLEPIIGASHKEAQPINNSKLLKLRTLFSKR